MIIIVIIISALKFNFVLFYAIISHFFLSIKWHNLLIEEREKKHTQT